MNECGSEIRQLDLPFTGSCTFRNFRYVNNWNDTEAQGAIQAAPLDFGSRRCSCARYAPRTVREASIHCTFWHADVYDHDDEIACLWSEKVRIVDASDSDIVQIETGSGHTNVEFAVRPPFLHVSLPAAVGGDHSVTAPCVNAIDDQDPMDLVQVDEHLDFVSERKRARFGHGSPMRRAVRKAFITGSAQIGIRTVSSTANEGRDDTPRIESDFLLDRESRSMGTESALDRCPADTNDSVTIGISALDPSVTPVTGAPFLRGFIDCDVPEILVGQAKRGSNRGEDLVKVAVDHDQSESAAIFASQVVISLVGRVPHHENRG